LIKFSDICPKKYLKGNKDLNFDFKNGTDFWNNLFFGAVIRD
jgi:hypothetical protein